MADRTKVACTHVIFDMDGLLLDTESIYTEITQRIAQKYGKNYDWTMKSKIMGRSERDAALTTIKLLELPITLDEYFNQCHKLWRECFPNCKIMAGAEKLISHFHSHNIPMSVATGSCEWVFKIKISNKAFIFDLFSHYVCSDDPEMKHGKPAPDIFQLASSRFSVQPSSPSNVLIFEDAPNGVQAARAANMNVVMVPDPKVDPSLCKKAHLVLKSLNEFEPTMWGLPPFDKTNDC